MSIPTLPDPDMTEVLAEVMRTHFPALVDAGVVVGVLSAHAKVGKNGEVSGCALKLHGVPCLALVRVNKLRDRVRGMADATIDVDADQWPNHTDKKKRSLMHHELQHLVVVYDKEDGSVKTDDAGRPKLKLRPHDWQIGGFDATVEAFGGDAHEAAAFADLHRHLSQKLLPFG